jgi:hypothetical protein
MAMDPRYGFAGACSQTKGERCTAPAVTPRVLKVDVQPNGLEFTPASDLHGNGVMLRMMNNYSKTARSPGGDSLWRALGVF